MSAGNKNQIPNTNIYLIGFMAAGKTAVGKHLAKQLHRTFFDTDEIIERQLGQNIAEVFRDRGETYFRGVESAVVADVARQQIAVVALGGGAILTPQNWQIIQATGVTVYLKWEITVLVKRLMTNDDRPLVFGNDEADRESRILNLFKKRESLYQRAGFTVACDESMPPERIADQIVNIIGKES